jgi:dipeptidyl aminopeptidase/acylaminoacyl peptidase
MKKFSFIILFITGIFTAASQERMSPELLWKLGRVSGVGVTKDNQSVVFTVSTPNVETNKSSKKTYVIPVKGGAAKLIADSNNYLKNSRISPDGKYKLVADEVKLRKVFGKDFYPDLQKSTAQVYDQLGYRHWDEWEDGAFSHIFVHQVGRPSERKDIMAGQPYDSPQKPFGGDEDFIWSPTGEVVYVTKPKLGTAYALSTNTDIFSYNIKTGTTTNLTQGMEGYDIAPSYSPQGNLAWLSMKREGYEADKQDIIVNTGSSNINLTAILGWLC